MFKLHDWLLLSIEYDWKTASCIFVFGWSDTQNKLIARNVSDLHVPHKNEWGPSDSVNTVTGPVDAGHGMLSLTIEMQSGDEITLMAAEFELAPS